MKSIIAFHDVALWYAEKGVLKDITLDIQPGDFVTVVGRSGCGKTTLLKLINGLLTPGRGTIFVEGENLAHVNQHALRRRIGYVIQSVGLFPHMKIRDNIAYVLTLLKEDKTAIDARVDALMEVMALEKDMALRYPNELSGGQKQRVGIARALAAQPKILLMDEPFSALDEITRGALQDEIARLQQQFGITVVFVTHDIQEALKLGSRVLILNEGSIDQFDTPAAIRDNARTDYVRRLVERHL